MIHRYNYNNIERNYDVLIGKRIIIWCRSVSALKAYNILYNRNIEVIGFTDSYVKQEGEVFAGLPVYTFKQIQGMDDIAIYIATDIYQYKLEILEKTSELQNVDVYALGDVWGAGIYDIVYMKQIIKDSENKIDLVRKNLIDEKSKEIFEKLLEYRITNNKKLISEIYDQECRQYFPEGDWFRPEKDEVFIDAGAYDGVTSREFCDWAKEGYSRIYMLEPDSLMFSIAKEYSRLNNMEDIEILNSGAYSFCGEIRFQNDSSTGSSKIDENGNGVIHVISIDEMLRGEKATFIKMDIEGAEMEALKGAERTIKKYKPKLAISIYHKESDLWEIPYYILTHCPWYRIHIRHYALTTNETVLYASL